MKRRTYSVSWCDENGNHGQWDRYSPNSALRSIPAFIGASMANGIIPCQEWHETAKAWAKDTYDKYLFVGGSSTWSNGTDKLFFSITLMKGE